MTEEIFGKGLKGALVGCAACLCAIWGVSCVKIGSVSVGEPSTKPPIVVVDIDSHIWAWATIYPDGYDWQSDTGRSDPGRPALLCDGGVEAVLDDRDSWTECFVAGGHLYDFLDSDGTTVLRRDGEQCLSWEGEELVWDIASKDDNIYTVSTALDGSSMSIRMNGEALRSYSSCWPQSLLYEDSGLLCVDVVGEMVGTVRPDGDCLFKRSDFAAADEITAHTIEGDCWLLLKTIGKRTSSCTFFNTGNGSTVTMTSPYYYQGILYGGSEILYEVEFSGLYRIYSGGMPKYSSSTKFTRSSSVCESSDVAALGRTSEGGWAVFRNGEVTALPQGAKPGNDIALRYGRLIVPLALQNGNAGMWDDGSVTDFGLNGKTNHVSLGRGSSRNYYLSH